MSPASMIRQARTSAGLTQAALAARLGVPQSVVARLERPGSNPTWQTLTGTLRASGHELKLTRRNRSGPGLDVAQLAERLALTPAQRLRLFESSHKNLLRLQAAARRRDEA